MVLGGMFFEEFYGQFTNSYTSVNEQQQSAMIFVGVNAMFGGYIGTQQLPDGPNPFTPYVPPPPPTPPSSGSLLWLWILLGALVVILVIVVVVVKVFKKPAADDGSDDEQLIVDDPTAAQRLTQGRVNKSEVSASRGTATSRDTSPPVEEEDSFEVDKVV